MNIYSTNKGCFTWVCSKELSANQISGFLSQLYFKSNLVNQRDFLHVEIDSRKMKGDLKIFSEVLSKMQLANQIAEFFNQLYLK